MSEAPNSLQANTYFNVIDLLGEGEIGGPANDNNWYKSTYLNGIVIQNDDDTFNFDGVNIEGRVGTAPQEYLPGFDSVEATIVNSRDVTVAGGSISSTISDTDVDSVEVILSIPALLEQKGDGDIVGNTIKFGITVSADGGAGTEYDIVWSWEDGGMGTITGKCTSEYRRSYTISNISQYGPAPWVVTVTRYSGDSVDTRWVNAFKWYAYTEIIDVKLQYYKRAVVGMRINSQEFGQSLPSRAYKVNGRKIKVPSNYDVTTRTYTGYWDGTFIEAVSSNPAWIVYDLLTDKVAALGNEIPESMVDKWTLYSCGVYCDEQVPIKTLTPESDGTYTEVDDTEPRFSFVGPLQVRNQGLETVQHVCSSMRVTPMWVNGQVSFYQDKPITTPAIPVGASNVKDGDFSYTGVPRRAINTVAKVSWNNPDLLGVSDLIELVDESAVIDFGYNESEVTAMGCVSRTEAVRYGSYILETDAHPLKLVSFVGGLEFADAIPGRLLAVQDVNYADKVLEGRVLSSTLTSVTMDKTFDLTAGDTYTIILQTASGDSTERELSNSSGETATLTWSDPLTELPFVSAMAILSSESLEPRYFVLLSVAESGSEYTVGGVEYDAGKYARIDSGFVSEVPITTNLKPNALVAPTDVSAEPYTYTVGDQGVRMFGIQIGWTNSVDPRVLYYELRYKPSDGSWLPLGTTGFNTNSYTWEAVPSGTYDIDVRAVAVGLTSPWVSYVDFSLSTELINLKPPTNLRTKDGSGLWGGPDCTILWDASEGSEYPSITGEDEVGDSNVFRYKVDVRLADTTLLKSFVTAPGALEYTYRLKDNIEDTSGDPSRDLLFYVYSVDPFSDASDTYASLAASNPAPDMSSSTPTIVDKYGYLQVNWTPSSDIDINLYKVYVDDSSPPTTLQDTVFHPKVSSNIEGLESETSYFAQVEPWDEFGAGVKSVVSLPANILKIPAINLDVELSGSIVRSDSDGNSEEDLEKLYDSYLGSGGITYTLTGSEKWVEYAYGKEDYMDRVGIWTDDANAQVYIAYSDDGSSWSFLCADADNGLTDYTLVSQASQATARTNFWQLEAGLNVGMFPNNILGSYVRLYLVGSYTTTIYEYVPSRILIAEMAAIRHLSVLSANAGIIIAGILQSDGYTSSDGLRIDLDDQTITANYNGENRFFLDCVNGVMSFAGEVTISSGSTGYENLADTPDIVDVVYADFGDELDLITATIAGGVSTPAVGEEFITIPTEGESPLTSAEAWDALDQVRTSVLIPGVTGGSKAILGYNACSTAMTYADALVWVADQGMRLPTRKEAVLCRWTGCSHDARMMWTSDQETVGKRWTVYGYITDPATDVELLETSTSYVVMVTDDDLTFQAQEGESPLPTDEVFDGGDLTITDVSLPGLTGGRSSGLGYNECSGEQTYAEALVWVAKQGARLPTRAEVILGRNAGCSGDAYFHWTSEQTTAGKRWTVYGNTNDGRADVEEFEDASGIRTMMITHDTVSYLHPNPDYIPPNIVDSNILVYNAAVEDFIAAVEDQESDSVLSVAEKIQWQVQWPAMQARYDALVIAAAAVSISSADATWYRNTLYDLLNTIHDVFADPPVSSAISQGVLSGALADFNTSLEELVDLISTEKVDVLETDVGPTVQAVEDMEADGVFSVAEKRQWQIEWPGMDSGADAVIVAATTAGVSSTAFASARNTLYNYLNSTHDVFNSSPSASNFTTATLSGYISNFYSEKEELVDLISTEKVDVLETDLEATVQAVEDQESDSVFSVAEKIQWQVQWPGMQANYTAIVAAGTAASVSTSAATSYRNTLYTLLNTTHDVFDDPPTASAIVQGTLSGATANFYTGLQELVDATATANTQAWSGEGADKTADVDLAAQINSNTTTISGGKITTGSVDTLQLAANSVTSTEVSSTDVFAINVESANFVSGVTGFKLDSENDTGEINFPLNFSGTVTYGDITGTPTTLNEVESGTGTKLAGIETGADATDYTTINSSIDDVRASSGSWVQTPSVTTASGAWVRDASGTGPLIPENTNAIKILYAVAVTQATGTVTSATVRFEWDGSAWSLTKVKELGTSSNHPEFYLASGSPAIRLYNHTSTYPVRVTVFDELAADKTSDQDLASLINNKTTTIDGDHISTGSVDTLQLHADAVETATINGHAVSEIYATSTASAVLTLNGYSGGTCIAEASFKYSGSTTGDNNEAGIAEMKVYRSLNGGSYSLIKIVAISAHAGVQVFPSGQHLTYPGTYTVRYYFTITKVGGSYSELYLKALSFKK